MHVLSPMVGIHLMYYDCHTTPLRAHHGMECFFATTGGLPTPTTFWGGIRMRSYAQTMRSVGEEPTKGWTDAAISSGDVSNAK
jgi:hypothetical protein